MLFRRSNSVPLNPRKTARQGFPPIQIDYVECIKLEQISEKGIDGCDRDEFLSLFEENNNIYSIIEFVTNLHDSFLSANSEHVYDTNLSLSLSNPDKAIDKGEKC